MFLLVSGAGACFVLCYRENSVKGHHGGRGGRLCGRRLTFSKGVCLAFRPFSLPTRAGRQARFRELCEPPPSRPCRVPGSRWKVSARFSAILKEKALTLRRSEGAAWLPVRWRT